MTIKFTLGLMLGWSSPYLAQLTAEDSPLPLTTGEASWVASLFNFGRFFGAVIGCVSVHYFGSKRMLMLTGFPLIISWICIIMADSVVWLYAARIACGISMGISFSSFPIYLGEVSHPKIRGGLVALALSGIMFGTVVGNSLGAYVSMSLFSFVSLVPNIAFILLFLWLPESPHYLVRIGRFKDAQKSLARYNPHMNSAIEVESLKEFNKTSGTLTFLDRLREFKLPKNRKSGLIGLALYFFMQFSGLNSVVFYAEMIFASAKLTIVSPATAVIIISGVALVVGWISVYIADKFARKVLMIVSSAGVCVSMIGLGTHFALLDNAFDPNALQWLPMASLIGFQIFLNIGIAIIPSIIVSELFSPNIKSLAVGAATIAMGLYGFAATKCHQPLVEILGEAYAFWINALLMFLCIIFCAIYLPETKGKSLQEIQDTM